MYSVTISILFLAAQLLGLRAGRNPPHIPEQFNATLAPSPLFSRQLDLLNIQVFSHFNSTNGATQPLLISENDTNKTYTRQIYYNKMAGFLYSVVNGTCIRIPVDEVDIATLMDMPCFMTTEIISGFNREVKYELRSYPECPYRKEIPCTQWGFTGSGILAEIFGPNPFGAYLMDNGDPIAFVSEDSISLLKFETFFSGPQPNSRFLPADIDKCHLEIEEVDAILNDL